MVLQDFLDRLDGVKRNGDKYTARCPAHHDSNPSLSVSVGNDGRILLHCFAGCSAEDVAGAIGLTMKDLFAEVTSAAAFPPYPPSSPQYWPVKEAEYIYAGGTLKKIKMRKPDGGKYCYWQHMDGNKWKKGRGSVTPGLYQSQPDIPEIFFLVEGEKDVDTLKRAGMVAVSLPDGAQSKWEAAYNDVFQGKQVIILPDNDDPGKKYARMCAGKCYDAGAAVKLLELENVWPEMPPKADVSDMIMQFGQSEAMNMVVKLANDTAPWEPKQTTVENPFLSLFKPLTEFEEEEATWLIPGWIPENQITLISADGGVGKTTLWCNIAAALSSGKSCILDPPGHRREPKRVAFCTTEDSVRKKLMKKMRESGANMANVTAMDLASDRGGELRDFKFGTPKMEQFIKYCAPDVVIFDPVQGFIPADVNMGSRNAMRDCMAPLIGLGEDVGTTFIIICHTNKRKGAFARDRIADSADLWDISRSVIMAGFTDSPGIRYCSNEKNNYAQLQETILFSIDGSGQTVKEGTSWKRDREYMLEAATAKAKPQREDCREFILSTLETATDHCMKSDELQKEAGLHGFAFATFKRARTELKNENAIEIYADGSNRNKSRTWYTRLKPISPHEPFQELPFDLPTPFDTPSE